MTPVDKLVQSIQRVLDDDLPAQNIDKLAADFAQWCATANRRLEQCERLLDSGAEQEALQLAETPPSLLDLCAALSFDKVDQWQALCRAKSLPMPEGPNERGISRLNNLYAKGITSAHPLYRDYRRAIAERDDERALSILRTIVRLNPGDGTARQEIQRLENKVRDETYARLAQAVKTRDLSVVIETLEQIEAAGWTSPVNTSLLSQARAIREERERELAFERCCGLVTLLDRIKDREVWTEAIGPIQEIERLCSVHGITLNAESAETFDEVRTWAYDLKKADDQEHQFQDALRDAAFLVEKGETNDAPGAPHNLKSLCEERHALTNKWRELEAFDRPVSEDLQTRVKRRSSVLQAEINRLTRQRRLLTTLALVASAVVVLVAAVTLFRWRWTNSQIAELEKLQQERRVSASETFIADLRRNKPKAVTQSKLGLAVQKSEQWIAVEHQQVSIFREMLAKLERHERSSFEDAPADVVAKEWQQALDFSQKLAPEYRNTGQAQFLEFENRFDNILQARKREAEEKFQALLKRAEEYASVFDQADLSLSVCRKNVAGLVETIDGLDKLANPPIEKFRLPSSLAGRIVPLRERVAPYAEALSKLDRAEAAIRQATTLEQYYKALDQYDADHLRQVSAIRAARQVGNAKLTLLEVERLLLMPKDAEAWQAFVKNPSPSGLPTEVMPAELSKWLSLRDDDNLRDIYRYEMPASGLEHPICSPLVHSTLYTRGPISEIVGGGGQGGGRMHFTATACTISDSGEPSFEKLDFTCEYQQAELPTREHLGGLSPESSLLRQIDLAALINDDGDKFRRPLLPMLDELRAADNVSPLFKAYVHWRLLDILAIRPEEWGARIVPVIDSDRAALKEMGVAQIRSGDWMVPARTQGFEPRLAEFYKQTRDVSYVKQAQFFQQLFADAHAAGMKFAGYVTADGELALTSDGAHSRNIWGLSENGLKLAFLYHREVGVSDGAPFTKPQPLSPLFYSGREPGELLKVTGEKVQLDWRSSAIKDYLPPLFRGEVKP